MQGSSEYIEMRVGTQAVQLGDLIPFRRGNSSIVSSWSKVVEVIEANAYSGETWFLTGNSRVVKYQYNSDVLVRRPRAMAIGGNE